MQSSFLIVTHLFNKFLQAVPLPENNRDPEMPGQQAVVFRRLPQGMLSTLSSEFEVLALLFELYTYICKYYLLHRV